MLVSFIIPSYNSAHTIARCLDSIYALSLKPQEYEVIFIDDCSADNTCEIVAEYQSKHSNITLLKQPKNNRQGAARNRGVSVAKGEYICFVDSDDAVTDGVVAAIRMAEEKKTDMTTYHYAFVNEQGEITKEAKKLSFAEGQIFSGIEMQNNYPYWCSAPWGYIYSKEFLDRVNYPFFENVLFEDSDFVVVHLYHAQRVTYSSESGYIAYYREGSTTHNTSYKNVADYLLLGSRMLAFYELMSERMNELTSEGEKQFAEGVLEGACYNVARSCRRLLKLSGLKEIRDYYERIDTHVSRKELCKNISYRKYYWNAWTSICLNHKHIAIVIWACLAPFYRLLKQKY